MELRLLKMELEQFKGYSNKSITFNENITNISGCNEVGKTTIADAFYYCLCNKDYLLSSNPYIKPHGVEESIPSVKLYLNIDGKDVTIRKFLITKVGKDGVSKNFNNFEVNDVPMTEKDMKIYFEGLQVDIDNILVYSHPNVFMGQNNKDIRELLFKMATSISDLEIARSSEETKELATQLKMYSVAEVVAMQKARKKKSEEQIKALPNQIVGMEKSKTDCDFSSIELAKSAALEIIKRLKFELYNGSFNNVNQEELLTKLNELEIEKMQAKEEHNSKAKKALTELEIEIDKARDERTSCKRMLEDIKVRIQVGLEDSERIAKRKDELCKEYKEVKARTCEETSLVFDENSTICSMCGQLLPSDRINALRADFENRKTRLIDKFNMQKEEDVHGIIINGDIAKMQLMRCVEELEKLKAKEDVINAELLELDRTISDLEFRKLSLPIVKEDEDIEECMAIQSNINKVKEDLERCKAMNNSLEERRKSLQETLSLRETEVRGYDQKLALAIRNAEIDDNIVELKQELLGYEQARADSERLLNQVAILSKHKNTLQESEINSHFKYVKWLLWEEYLNGEYKEVCIPTVDGFKRFDNSMSGGRKIQAKLDICSSLQRYLDQHVPIFLDEASEIDSDNIPTLDTQLITLSRTDSKSMEVD